MELTKSFLLKVHEDVSFKYNDECAAVDLLNNDIFTGKYFPYPALHIIFCLFELNSNPRQPA